MAEKSGGKIKALLLYSGGLDSILSAKILERQGIDVTALTCESYFFDAGQARKSAEANDIRIISKDISEEHLGIVKNPRFGRGSGMNPCIDCHLLMIKQAGELVSAGKYDFLATGEVLGQRPMSQNNEALKLIEREAGLVGKILRPLSAGVLPETEMEKSGLIDRKKLLGISGRSRKGQIELAKKLGVEYFPTPAGGCILTDKEFSKKLRELLENIKNLKPSDFALLRIGRHFWEGKTKIILGRNHKENLALKKLAGKGDALLEPENIPGPTALLRGKIEDKNIETAKQKIMEYTKNPQNEKTDFILKRVEF